MIRSIYLRIFFFGLPGVYFALWLSRFSLSMVNALPYYYGMIMSAVSIACGVLISFTLLPSFENFFKKNNIQIILGGLIFLGIGHTFNLMDAGIYAADNFAIIYYFSGLAAIGAIGTTYIRLTEKSERKILLSAFITGSIISYFIGVKYFEQSSLDMYLGIPVVLIILLYQLCIIKKRSFYSVAISALMVLINIAIMLEMGLLKMPKTIGLTHLGYAQTAISPDKIDIYDHKHRIFNNIQEFSLLNANDLLTYLLQTNKAQNNILFIGYPGSLTPFLLYKSPFTKKIDTYFWDMPIPKGYLHPTISKRIFFQSEWDFFNLAEKKEYDLIIIENIPLESVSSCRIFILYCKRLLNNDNGVIVIPDYMVRKNDGQYLKITQSSPLVMIMGAQSTDKTDELKKRFDNFISKNTGIPPENCSISNIPQELIKTFDPATSKLVRNDFTMKKILPRQLMQILLWGGLGLYLIFRLFKSRYKNNQNLFFTFEAGFTFSIIIFTSLMLLSELRLVYPFFPPALFGISMMVMIPLKNKKWQILCQVALLSILIYFTSINFIRAFPIIYVLPVLLPLAFLGISATLGNCKINNVDNNQPHRNIYFALGILFTLLLLLCAKNNNLYSTLIHIAIITRFFYIFKI